MRRAGGSTTGEIEVRVQVNECVDVYEADEAKQSGNNVVSSSLVRVTKTSAPLGLDGGVTIANPHHQPITSTLTFVREELIPI